MEMYSTYSIVDQPSNGTVSLVGNIATYTPNDLYDGFDSFTFIVNDGIVDSNIATVSITINNCLVNLSQADPLKIAMIILTDSTFLI